MKLLSEQIRDFVRQSSTSAHAIGQEAGIDKSTMSRFMNGGKLTMDRLDRLAQVLGLVVEPHVSLVPKALEKGRPAKKEKKMTELLDTDYLNEVADDLAQEAHQDYFHSRRGVWHIEDIDQLFIYNNNPWGLDLTERTREMLRIEKRLKKLGIKVTGRGAAGDELEGSDELYTVGLLLDCSEDRMRDVARVVEEEAGVARRNIEKLLDRKKKS